MLQPLSWYCCLGPTILSTGKSLAGELRGQLPTYKTHSIISETVYDFNGGNHPGEKDETGRPIASCIALEWLEIQLLDERNLSCLWKLALRTRQQSIVEVSSNWMRCCDRGSFWSLSRLLIIKQAFDIEQVLNNRADSLNAMMKFLILGYNSETTVYILVCCFVTFLLVTFLFPIYIFLPRLHLLFSPDENVLFDTKETMQW